MQKLLVGSVCFALLSAVTAASEAQVANVQAPKAALGITMNDNSLPGVTVMSVVPGSPAAHIGLQSGDRILAINGKPTTSFRDITHVVETSRPNAPIELTVARGVWQGKLTVELGTVSTVFTPTALRSLQQPAPAAAAPATVYYVPAPSEPWQFPNNMFDNGNRGAAASYGGGGY